MLIHVQKECTVNTELPPNSVGKEPAKTVLLKTVLLVKTKTPVPNVNLHTSYTKENVPTHVQKNTTETRKLKLVMIVIKHVPNVTVDLKKIVPNAQMVPGYTKENVKIPAQLNSMPPMTRPVNHVTEAVSTVTEEKSITVPVVTKTRDYTTDNVSLLAQKNSSLLLENVTKPVMLVTKTV